MLLQCCAGKDSAEGHRTTERLHALAATRERRLTEKQEAKAASEAAECTHAPQTTPYRRDDRRLVPDGRWRSGSEQHQHTLLLQQEEDSREKEPPSPPQPSEEEPNADESQRADAPMESADQGPETRPPAAANVVRQKRAQESGSDSPARRVRLQVQGADKRPREIGQEQMTDVDEVPESQKTRRIFNLDVNMDAFQEDEIFRFIAAVVEQEVEKIEKSEQEQKMEEHFLNRKTYGHISGELLDPKLVLNGVVNEMD